MGNILFMVICFLLIWTPAAGFEPASLFGSDLTCGALGLHSAACGHLSPLCCGPSYLSIRQRSNRRGFTIKLSGVEFSKWLATQLTFSLPLLHRAEVEDAGNAFSPANIYYAHIAYPVNRKIIEK
jgi:hypothetical protein